MGGREGREKGCFLKSAWLWALGFHRMWDLALHLSSLWLPSVPLSTFTVQSLWPPDASAASSPLVTQHCLLETLFLLSSPFSISSEEETWCCQKIVGKLDQSFRLFGVWFPYLKIEVSQAQYRGFRSSHLTMCKRHSKPTRVRRLSLFSREENETQRGKETCPGSLRLKPSSVAPRCCSQNRHTRPSS